MASTKKDKAAENPKNQLEYVLYYLSFLLHYKYLIAGITALAAVLSVLYSIISISLPPEKSPYPNYYRAYSVLIIGQENVSGMASMLSALGIDATLGGTDMNYGDLAIRILQSRPFLDEIVERHDIIERYNINEMVKTKSRSVVLSSSEFDFDQRTGTLTISYTNIDPVFARDMVQSMVSNLQKWFQSWEGTTSQQELIAMQEKIAEVSSEIDRLEEEIQSFQTEYGVLSVEQIAESQTAILTDLQSQLIQTEIAIKNYSGFSTIEDPELIQLQAQRESLQQIITQIEQGRNSAGRTMPSKEELPTLATEFAHLQMYHQIQMRIFQNLTEQYEIQKLASTGSSMFSVLEPAEIPDVKSGPYRGKLCMMVTIFAFFASIVISIFVHIIFGIIHDPKKKSILLKGFSKKKG